MSTAPDNLEILVAYDCGEIEKVIIINGRIFQACCHSLELTRRGLTNWMHLPPLPDDEEEEYTLYDHVQARHTNPRNITVTELLRLVSHYLEGDYIKYKKPKHLYRN